MGSFDFYNNPTGNCNILYLLFCNDPMFVSHLVTSAPVSTSDHDSLIIYLLIDIRCDTNAINKSNVWSYNLSTLVISLINNYLSQIDWISEFSQCHSAAAAVWDSFNGHIKLLTMLLLCLNWRYLIGTKLVIT